MLVNNHNYRSNKDAGACILCSHKKRNGLYKPQRQIGHPSKQHSNQTNQPTNSTTFQPHKPSNSSFASEHRALCQIRGKSGHQALDCLNRINFSYQGHHPPSQLATMVAKQSYTSEEHTLFSNSRFNAHIIVNMNNLTISEPYNGGKEVTVGNGSGLYIATFGSSTLTHTKSKFHK